MILTKKLLLAPPVWPEHGECYPQVLWMGFIHFLSSPALGLILNSSEGYSFLCVEVFAGEDLGQQKQGKSTVGH